MIPEHTDVVNDICKEPQSVQAVHVGEIHSTDSFSIYLFQKSEPIPSRNLGRDAGIDLQLQGHGLQMRTSGQRMLHVSKAL